MAEVRTSSQCERPCAGIEETRTAPGDAGGSSSPVNGDDHTGKRLAGKPHEPFERADGGRAKARPPPTLQRRSRRTTTGDRPRSWWSKGRGPRGTRARTARAGLRTGQACHRGWTAYGMFRRQTPKVGAECPNWARSDLCGGRSVMGVPTAIRGAMILVPRGVPCRATGKIPFARSLRMSARS